MKSLSRVRLFATPWTVAYQASPSMGFSRQGYWSGCHCLLQDGLLSRPCVRVLSCFVVFDPVGPPWSVTLQAPLSVGFSRQENWSGLLSPSPGALLTPGL